MSARSYKQACPIARALDAVGDRWTLLIVRDLALGPQRHSDLRRALPTLSPHLLSKRLRDMEQAGLVTKQRLPPPAASTVYALSESGRGLFPALQELSRWGSHWGAAAKPEQQRRFPWLVFALEVFSSPTETGGIGDVYQFCADGEIYTVRVGENAFDVAAAPVERPDVTLMGDSETMYDLASGRLSLREAERAGRLVVDGQRRAASRAVRVLSSVAKVFAA